MVSETPHWKDPDYPRDGHFYRLLDAVLVEPEKVPGIVREDPAILEAHNGAGETVLHFLAVEGVIEGIELLRSLGAKIPEFAIYHAVEGGQTETVIRLLELGGHPLRSMCEQSLEHPLWEFTRKRKRLIRSYLDQYEYDA